MNTTIYSGCIMRDVIHSIRCTHTHPALSNPCPDLLQLGEQVTLDATLLLLWLRVRLGPTI